MREPGHEAAAQRALHAAVGAEVGGAHREADDGTGGAHLGKGHGLAGLTDRLEIVEGSLEVSSPAGGPTELTAEIPLAGLGEG